MLLFFKISIIILFLENTNSKVTFPTAENRFFSSFINSIASKVHSFVKPFFPKPLITQTTQPVNSRPVLQTEAPFEIKTSKMPSNKIINATPKASKTTKAPNATPKAPNETPWIQDETPLLIIRWPHYDTSEIKECKEEKIKSCTVAEINSYAFNYSRVSIPHCKDMVMKDVIDSSSKAYRNDDGCDAMFQLSNGELMGNIEINGKDFYIEPCSSFLGCHVWKEQNTNVFKDNDNDKPYIKAQPLFGARLKFNMVYTGSSNTKTMVGYSVKFYYTKEFRNIMISGGKRKIMQYFKLIVAETNQGYRDSGLPVRMQIHCIELMRNLRETSDPQQMLEAFKKSKRYVHNLRDGADVAILIVSKMGNDGCGMGYVDSWRSGFTLSIVEYQCARGYYSLGHEVAHNFGCVHDRDHEHQQPSYNYAYGSHISRGPYRTIMAYNGPRHHQRVNVYSSPKVRYRGLLTGNAYSDCARVIMENRFAVSEIGNERTKCRWRL